MAARAGALRAATSAYGETVLVREALGRRPLLRVVQSPAGAYRHAGSALPFPTAIRRWCRSPAWSPSWSAPPRATRSRTSAARSPAWSSTSGPRCVPRRLMKQRSDDPDAAPTLVDVTTTGLAVNANAPGARPPQAILLALSADGGDWTADRLVKVLDEALALARMRTLTLQQIPFVGRVPAGAVLPRLVAAGRAGDRLDQGRDRVRRQRAR